MIIRVLIPKQFKWQLQDVPNDWPRGTEWLTKNYGMTWNFGQNFENYSHNSLNYGQNSMTYSQNHSSFLSNYIKKSGFASIILSYSVLTHCISDCWTMIDGMIERFSIYHSIIKNNDRMIDAFSIYHTLLSCIINLCIRVLQAIMIEW